MKFRDYICVSKGFEREILRFIDSPITYRHVQFEFGWIDGGKPYYNVYPAIIPMLTSLKLDMSGSYIKPPRGLKNLLLRLPDSNHSLRSNGVSVRTIFMSFQKCMKSATIDDIVPRGLKFDPVGDITDDIAPYVSHGLVVGIDVGEIIDGNPSCLVKLFPIDERPLEESINILRTHDSFYDGIRIPGDLILNCVRLCLTVCLLDDDAKLISPEVLSSDFDRYRCADDDLRLRLVDKAKRRGKFGFVLGRDLEVVPHVRRPHPALVWTGVGRSVPKIIMRSGSIVHRDKIRNVPTGYLKDNDG